MTGIDRRSLLLAASVLPLLAARARGSQAAFFAATTRPDHGQPRLLILGEDAILLKSFDLPGRGHGTAWSPQRREGILFARRPGRWALLFDLESSAPARLLEAAPGRHFYGHGCFSPDGSLLYASENDYEAARGVVGVYDAVAGYRRLGEFDSGGVGPHDLLALGEDRLIVANGGIETHPDYGRAKLNLDSMAPNVSVIRRRDGRVTDCHRLPRAFRHLSLRHLALDPDGRVWFAAQHEGPGYEAPPLVGWLAPKAGLRFAAAPDEGWRGLGGYSASIVSWKNQIAVTAPRGDRLLLWRAGDGAFLRAVRLSEPYALAALSAGLMVAGKGGELWRGGHPLFAPSGRFDAWDNHALMLPD